MIRRVLVPLDGSEMAASMLTRLPTLLGSKDTHHTLLTAVDPRQPVDLLGPTKISELTNEATNYLNGIAAKLRDKGVEVNVRVDTGAAAELILEVADDEESSLICVSTHGRSGIGRMMYGSITEKIVRASQRPVLVVPSFERTEPRAGVDRRKWDFRSIVVALDGSRQAMQIIPHVAAAVKRFDAKVTLLLVLDEDADAKLTKDAETHLEGATGLFAKAGVETTMMLRRGEPAEEILDYTPRYDHDMVMMTTHGRSGLSRWMLGSVAEKVVRHATVPVFVVRSTPVEKS